MKISRVRTTRTKGVDRVFYKSYQGSKVDFRRPSVNKSTDHLFTGYGSVTSFPVTGNKDTPNPHVLFMQQGYTVNFDKYIIRFLSTVTNIPKKRTSHTSDIKICNSFEIEMVNRVFFLPL